ncbi:two component regulator with propeller domain [Dysgonomonas alginatilytica]|uniref:histidine kinase n=1 Tax=Dysgonomonas alginatilytica TaxID=1605892 RepID=A0A2V3PRE3_9BACT|nr:two-component regulator propeller domain-containing protein [Dysgonomonas alginatilytica]PXV64716.1 two component regulator with propeller domain [Dysgonomonas alginatilytica]
MKIIISLLLLALNSAVSIIYAQSFDFSHLDNSDGLSNNQVECIFKDSRGFMWFGTNQGLNRYDGQNFKVYKHSRNEYSSIPFDRVTNIQEDAQGKLWLQIGNAGYIVYDFKSESFTQNIDSLVTKMGLPPSPSLVEIDTHMNLYFYYKEKGIYKYNIETDKYVIFNQSKQGQTLSPGEIIDLKIHNQYIWVLYRDGLIERFNEKTNLTDIRNTFFRENSKNSTIQKSLFVDADNDVWVYPGVGDKGSAYYDIKANTWIFLNKDSEIALSSNFFRCIDQDKEGLIWIGTDHGGLNIFDKSKKKITVLRNNIYNNNSISQNSIISIFCDNDGIIWIGTYKKGISYYHPNMFKFKKSPLFYHLKEDSETFDCNSLYKDDNNNLWIGTNGRGLIKYNEEKQSIETFNYNANNPKSISADIVTSILEDHSKTLWVGTFLGGLNSFDGKSFTRYQINETDSNSISGKSVYGLAEDKDNNLWIGTLGGGVNSLNSNRTNFTRYTTLNTKELYSDYILSVYTDINKNIYLSTDRGVNIIDTNSKVISTYFKDQIQQDSLSNILTNNILVDSRNLTWIATDNGLNIYNPLTKRFVYITSKQGLPSDEVVSLIEDNNNNIWAGTRNGLACIHCQYTNNTLDYTITYFDSKDGLPSSICNQNAMFKDKNGIIYVGSTNGYVNFDPNNIIFNEYIPKPRFTELLIANQAIRPNEKYNNRVIINQSITYLDQITLNYKETNFTLQFSALNYIHPEKNHYKYMLEGLDTDWIEVKNGVGAASYSNLNSGTYKLIIYAGNNDGVWSDTPLIIKIIVKPPFWLTWWAFFIYFIIFVIVLRFFILYKLNKQKHEFKQAQKIMEADKIHEVDELKFRFFTNISHEFKTPITLILTPLEKLMKEPHSEEQKTLLTIMRKNALSLLNMVNEILDFRKLDLNKMNLNLSTGDIIPIVREICQSFSSLAADKSIKFTFTTYLKELQVDFDPEKMSKIIINLISNAFKYTEEGHIDVSVGITEEVQKDAKKQLCIKVSDTGIGIESKYLEKIFDRFYRIEQSQKNNQAGTGVGLHLVSEYVKLHNGEISVESTAGKGSTFTVLIPIDNSTYKESKSQDVIYSGDIRDTLLTEPETSAVTAKDSNLPLLLIVDDNEDFREFIKSLFIHSYRIITANDGEEASQIILDQLPDIILCDVMMPKMDGYELCRKIKADIRTSHIPIILLTAKSSEENQYSGIEAGADDYISKPFNIDMLTLKISKIIERQKKNQYNFKKKIEISPSEIEIMTMDEKFVKKAISIVEENIGNADFLVEDLCREMAMSRVYFYKKILALTDKSPSEFIRFIRLKRAANLLEKSQMFVNEVAFQVGFNDPKYFRKYFKDEFGVTPNEYKKKFTN